MVVEFFQRLSERDREDAPTFRNDETSVFVNLPDDCDLTVDVPVSV